MALNDNLKDLGILLQAMRSDHLSRADFTKAFKELVNAIQKTRAQLTEETTKINKNAVKEFQTELDRALTLIQKAEKNRVNFFNGKVEELKSDQRTFQRMLESRLNEITSSIPDDYDDEEIRSMIDGLRSEIPEIPEMPEKFDPTDIMEDLEKLEKKVDALEKRPVGQGGGVTNARIQQAFKYILKTEQPSGLINGSNKTYTVSQPIFAVLAFSLNGEVITELPNYTINGNTITFGTALPAAYSGKDFECKYI